MLQALVLDFDGVIVNSEPLHLRAYQSLLADEGVSLSARDYYERFVGLTDRALFSIVAGGRPDADAWVDLMIERKSGRMQRLLEERAPIFPGAAARVRDLARSVPLAIASGALRAEIEQMLERAAIADCFRAIVAAGDTPRSKPAPDPYLRAVADLSRSIGRPLEASCIVAIEDTTQGLTAARRAGLATVALTTTFPAAALTADLVLPDLQAVTLDALQRLVRRS